MKLSRKHLKLLIENLLFEEEEKPLSNAEMVMTIQANLNKINNNDPKLSVDGKWGKNTTTGWQKALNSKMDKLKELSGDKITTDDVKKKWGDLSKIVSVTDTKFSGDLKGALDLVIALSGEASSGESPEAEKEKTVGNKELYNAIFEKIKNNKMYEKGSKDPESYINEYEMGQFRSVKFFYVSDSNELKYLDNKKIKNADGQIVPLRSVITPEKIADDSLEVRQVIVLKGNKSGLLKSFNLHNESEALADFKKRLGNVKDASEKSSPFDSRDSKEPEGMFNYAVISLRNPENKKGVNFVIPVDNLSTLDI